MSGSFRELQQRHFDGKLDAYREMYGKDTPFHLAMTDQLIRFAGAKSGERVLDVGCGLGRATIPLLRAGCTVTGLDISAVTLDALGERVRRLGLENGFSAICSAIEHFDVRQSFDLVIGRGILHHIEDPPSALSRLTDALLAGGRLVFMDPNPLNPAWIPFILLHPHLSWRVERGVMRGTPGRTASMLRGAGLERVSIDFTGLVPPPLWGRWKTAAKLEQRLRAVRGLRRLAAYLLVRGFAPGGSL
jgi:SAM-dependent methyltransferase